MHDRAGSRRVVKLHGDIWILRCTECSQEWKDHRPQLPVLPPRCDCGGLARPGVIWFGEALPALAWQEAEDAMRSSAVLLVVGTSGVVYPAAQLVSIARTAGARVVEINVEDTAQSGYCDVVLRGRSGDLLPQLIA
jgi:NAD-dependent deacetylase